MVRDHVGHLFNHLYPQFLQQNILLNMKLDNLDTVVSYQAPQKLLSLTSNHWDQRHSPYAQIFTWVLKKPNAVFQQDLPLAISSDPPKKHNCLQTLHTLQHHGFYSILYMCVHICKGVCINHSSQRPTVRIQKDDKNVSNYLRML